MDHDGAQPDAEHLRHLAHLEDLEHHQVGDRVGRLARLAARLTQAVTADDVCESVARAGAAELQAGTVGVFLIDADGRSMQACAHAGFDQALAQRFASFDRDPTLPAWQALERGEVVAYRSIEERNTRYPHFQGHPGGAATTIVAPMVVHGDLPIGVLTIGWAEEGRADASDVAFTQAVADLCGSAVHRARLHDREQASHRRQRFLADATHLLTRSLDPEETLSQLAAAAVPDLADACAVCLADADDPEAIRPVAAHHFDAAGQAVLDRLVARQPVLRNEGLLHVVHSGDAMLLPVTDRAADEAVAEDEEHLGLIRAFDARSAVVVPLQTRGQPLGLILLVHTTDRRPMGDEDLALAAELADRAALAISNARLHEDVVIRSSNLAHALETRIVIEQAKGVLAGRHGIGVDQAFDRLRGAARARRRKIHDLARAVVDGVEDLPGP